MSDRAIIEQLAGGRPIIELVHARQRTEGVVGVAWRAGAVVAVCAHGCGLQALPEGLAALAGLERLDVGVNRLAALPALPASLRQLYVDDNQLARLPALPKGLRVLDANRNRLDALPALADLAFAYLAANRLTTLPSITNVRYLNVGGNPLGRLALEDSAIRELRAEQAQLHTLAIDQLAGLRELSLRGNDLVTLPELSGLTALRVLDLRGNQLDTLPDGVRDLALIKLDLRWNPLRAPPAWLDELSARGCLVYS